MRCPKCGYITFDRVERCGKCAHDLLMVSAQLRGPMAKVSPPMFLGGLLHGEMAAPMDDDGEVATIDLEGEELDLGEAVALDEELPAVEGAEEPEAEEPEAEAAIEMPSLSGIDVSDLMPPQEEAAPAEEPEEEVGGIEMPASFMTESAAPAAMAPEPADSDDGLSLDFDLTGGESRGSVPPGEEEEAGGGVMDLADLLGGLTEAPAAEPQAAGFDDELDLTLDSDDQAPSAPAATGGSPLDIPDLGLTLESDGEDDKPAS